MSSISNVIDLPAPPLHAIVTEGNLQGAPVVATLMEGKTRTGRLAALDGPRATLSLTSKDDNHTWIDFSNLRYLEFLTRHPVNNERHPLEQQAGEILMPGMSQEFRITYIDDKTFSGRTRSSYVDEIGIHLFQLVGNDKVSRLFIPAQVVKKHYIGLRKDSSRKTAGANPGRRKSDSGKTGPVAADASQLEARLEELSGRPENRASGMRIGGMLVEEGAITLTQLEVALAEQAHDDKRRIGEILVDLGAITSVTLYRTLAHKFGMPFTLLRNFLIDMTCLQLVPEDVARKYMLVPLLLHNDRLVVAMDDPTNIEAITLLHFITRLKIEPAIATADDINWAIEKHFGRLNAKPATDTATVTDLHHGLAPGADRRSDASVEEQPSMLRAVTSFLGNTILDAIERNTGDIHLIPTGSRINLLFRINGKLVPVRQVSRMLMPSIIARLGEMCDLPASVTDGPRQGRTCMLSGDTAIELRVTLHPEGLKDGAIIRILDQVARIGSLRDTGIEERELRSLTEMLTRSYSLLVISGKRNSGKTHTLYSTLRELQALKHDITTIETPIKYHVNGMEQIQGSDLDAAFRRIRSLKPRVLMIDDLHRPKALQTAAESALNGSLVIGKLHTPDAASAVAALCAEGVSPRLLNSTLSGVLAQHLVNINCLSCAEEEIVSADVRHELGVEEDEVFFHGTGCSLCNHVGHIRQQPVFELLRITPRIQELVRTATPAADIRRQAVSEGMRSLLENALYLARMRRTSLAEVWRLKQETDPDAGLHTGSTGPRGTA